MGVLFWLIIWEIAAVIIDKPIILPSPVSSFRRLGMLMTEGRFYVTAGNSFLRIALGFLCGLLGGTITGWLSSSYKAAAAVISPIMTALKSVPVASFTILALFWMRSSALSWFISFLIVIPVIHSAVREGTGAADKNLLEAAEIFGFSAIKKIRYIYLPAVMPFLLGACESAAGLAFKSGAAAEVIGQPDFTLGDMLYRSKIYLETADLFAWTAVIIILSKIFEKLIIALIKLIFRQAYKVK